ncbi:MAG TPA: hypothetical protein VFX59_27485 [Polyangiales bacterium]|nr:hypothetical protein [Polyangiales bacterium]
MARLEAALGTRLLERTTRMVRATDAGNASCERCAQILSQLEEANAADWSVRAHDVRVVCPSSRHLSPRVRLFIDMLAKEFERSLARQKKAKS